MKNKEINHIDDNGNPTTAGLNTNIILSFNNSKIMGVEIVVNIDANGQIVLGKLENTL